MADYFLKSERIGFSRWSEADQERAWEVFGDPELTKFVGGPFTREQVRAALAAQISSQNARGIQYWPLFLLSTAEFMGCCGLKSRQQPEYYELGCYLKTGFQHKGYAAEASRAVIAYGFETLKARTLLAGHHPGNQASRALVGKLGFSYIRDELYPPTGLKHALYRLNARPAAPAPRQP